MKAKKKPLDTKTLVDIGLDSEKLGESVTVIKAMQFPPEREGGRIVEGETAQEKAVELVKLLHDEAKVI